MEDNSRIWVIRGGSKGEADKLFLEHNVVAIGHPEVGSLKRIEANRTAFKEHYGRIHHNCHPASISGISSQLFRFVHEMKEGDLLLYPATKHGVVHIGTVAGPYSYERSPISQFPHHQPVNWIHKILRNVLSNSSQKEMRGAKTLFQIKKNKKEIYSFIPKSRQR